MSADSEILVERAEARPTCIAVTGEKIDLLAAKS